MKKIKSMPFSPDEKAELAELANLPEEAIDTSDAPGASDWSGAARGLFHSAARHGAVEVDADLIAWFRKHAKEGYRRRINRVLRDYVERQVADRS